MSTAPIRTTNWKNFNKWIPVKKQPEKTKAQRQFDFLQRFLKRFPLWNRQSIVLSTKRVGQVVQWKIANEAYTLNLLAIAIRAENRQAIKNAIDLRINTRGLRKCPMLVPLRAKTLK